MTDTSSIGSINVDTKRLLMLAHELVDGNEEAIHEEFGVNTKGFKLYLLVTSVNIYNLTQYGFGSNIRCIMSLGEYEVNSSGVLSSSGVIFSIYTTLEYSIITSDWHGSTYI